MENIENQLKEISEYYETLNEPNPDIDKDIEFRRQHNGIMPLCKNCSRDCKVPYAFGITNFTCFMYLLRKKHILRR